MLQCSFSLTIVGSYPFFARQELLKLQFLRSEGLSCQNSAWRSLIWYLFSLLPAAFRDRIQACDATPS
ncbi:hypothetical protein I7I50_07604 [Histoplasma capsulatum G186AR]|uniref:Uncharacterized protein n=1 Tax=Ajellomyces capsulatus TaxID=5037 RepID=A0A8H7YXY3_AJECA|nr:hypothetical protein I7I52_09323 [Histoplasma capsulatum]QSS68254.1 hypothetical protein I7I50_07604 [Histoplasma capsulatum G186AR]